MCIIKLSILQDEQAAKLVLLNSELEYDHCFPHLDLIICDVNNFNYVRLNIPNTDDLFLKGNVMKTKSPRSTARAQVKRKTNHLGIA